MHARVGAQIAEIFHGETRIAAYLRGRAPSRFVKWAKKIGPYTTALVEENFALVLVLVQVYWGCVGILKLGGEFGRAARERASQLELRRDQLGTAAVKQLSIESWPNTIRHPRPRLNITIFGERPNIYPV